MGLHCSVMQHGNVTGSPSFKTILVCLIPKSKMLKRWILFHIQNMINGLELFTLATDKRKDILRLTSPQTNMGVVWEFFSNCRKATDFSHTNSVTGFWFVSDTAGITWDVGEDGEPIPTWETVTQQQGHHWVPGCTLWRPLFEDQVSSRQLCTYLLKPLTPGGA